jgi:protease PrsW
MILIALSILPGLIVCLLMVRADKYEREPFIPLLICYLLGAAITIPAVRLELWASCDLNTYYSIKDTFYLAFGVVAWWEELLKFAILMIFVYPSRHFNEPLDGIVYAVMVSMGFATLENVAYADRFGAPSLLLRAFTAVPAHLVFAIVMGYYLGLAKFGKGWQPDRLQRIRLIVKGFLYAFLLHGTYDVLVFQQWFEWLFVMGTAAVYLCLFACNELIRLHLEASPFRPRSGDQEDTVG